MGVFGGLFSTFEFYSKILVSLITKGFNDKPDEETNLSEEEFYYSINRIYTNRKVKKMYFINELPKFVDSGFLHDLKTAVSIRCNQLNVTYGTNKKCELVDIVTAEPYELNFSTFKNRSRLNMWKRRYDSAMKQYGRNSAVDDLVESSEAIDKRDRNKWMIDSWLFVKRIKEEEKGEFCRTNIILELVSDSDDVLAECEKEMKDYLYRNDIMVKEVFLQSNDYNKSFTPAGNQAGKSLLSKMNPPSIMADTLINSFDVPTHGKVGDDYGVYVGNDIYSAMPVFYDFGIGSDAKNILLAASTGEGKSNYMKGLYSNFDLMGYNSIILDYEGDEYTPMGNLYDAVFIKVSGEQSRYFNTIAIGDLTGIKKIDADLKNEAVKITERVFSLLLDEHNGMTSHELSLYSDCVNRVYEKFGVTDDPASWYLSKECTYFHLYGELVEMSKEDGYIREYGQHIKDMVIKLRTYFEFDGINRSMFTNPVNIEEVLGNRHIVFSFGMKGTDESLINTKELALKQLFVGYITTLVSNYNKSKDRLTVVVVEELQRYLAHNHSASVVANMVSGGRKRGMIMIMITNAPLQLMNHLKESKNSEKDEKHIDAILNNINAHIIGKLKHRETQKLAEYYALEDALPSLNLINKGGEMRYSFLVHYKDEFSIVKYLLHPALLTTDLYVTRRDKKDSDKDAFISSLDDDIKTTVLNRALK